MCLMGFLKFCLPAIIIFNMNDFWPHFVTGADLGKPCVYLFDIAHTHILEGVYVGLLNFTT